MNMHVNYIKIDDCGAINYIQFQVVHASEARVNTNWIVSMSQMFPPALQILSAFKLMQYLIHLPEDKPKSEFCCYVELAEKWNGIS